MEQVIEKKQIKLTIVKYSVFAFCFFIFFDAKLLNLISPFAPALLFSLVWCGSNIYLLALIYFLSSLKIGFIPSQILVNAVSVFVLIICAIIQRRSNRKVNKPIMCLYLTLSQLGKFIYIRSVYFAVAGLIEIAFCILLFLSFSNFFQAFLLRTPKIKLNVDEQFCGGIFLISLSCALASFSYFGVNLGLLFVLFSLLVLLSILGYSKGMVCSILIGVGYFLTTKNINFLAFPIIFSLTCGIFAGVNKYLTSLCAVLTVAVLGFYFNFIPNFSLYEFAVCTFGILLYLLIKTKTMKNLKEVFISNDKFTDRAMINLSRKLDYAKFQSLGNLFENMFEVYKNMIKKKLSNQESAYMLAMEEKRRLCDSCPNKKVCFRESGKDMLNEFYDMFSVGITKKEINLIDIPNKVSAKCENIKKLFALSNSLLAEFVKFDNMQSAVNSSKLMVAQQMSSVAEILKSYAEQAKGEIVFNDEKEREIIQNLIYANITGISGALVAEEKNKTTIILSFLKEQDEMDLVAQIISKTMKIPFELASFMKDGESGRVSYQFCESSKCDIVFGVASDAKNGALLSGDVHSLVKISPSKFMMGICDGMGSGKQANDISDKTISLIENYYKVGYSPDEIISSVNKLYMEENEESYSALDLCVLDLNKLNADFIKLGSPQTFIKRKNETKVISGGALPVGADEKQKPKFSTTFIQPKDLIFMVSDGITDAFDSEEELSYQISTLKGNNPQELADKLLEIAKMKKSTHPDDMTVFVSRVYRKVQ